MTLNIPLFYTTVSVCIRWINMVFYSLSDFCLQEYTEEVHMEEEKMQEENDEDEFFRLLPDELLLYYDPRQGDTGIRKPLI